MIELRNTKQGINESVEEEEARNELFRKTTGIVNRTYPEIGNARVQDNTGNQTNIFAKPLNENYEDELVKATEGLKISRLERQVQNLKRQMNNRGNNRNQQRRRDYNRVPIDYNSITCYRCNKRGHYATKCPMMNNFQENERRINFLDEYDYEEYEEMDNDYDGYEEEYYDPYLYKYDYDLYNKDNPVTERRRSNRLNPLEGWRTFGKPNLDKEVLEKARQDEQVRNRVEAPMDEDNDGELYDKAAGLRKYWDEVRRGERERPTRKNKITPVKPKDAVDYENLLDIKLMRQKEITTAMRTQLIIENKDIEAVIDTGQQGKDKPKYIDETDSEDEIEYEPGIKQKLYTMKETNKENDSSDESETDISDSDDESTSESDTEDEQ
ncbi:hypothetical protein C1646_759627 [Rhizophagus diaphanus]|nr:hypothetical protein C1646_759627 [Rhizophagus diaphanus] [Rhizophagus sp. MUCL 43196]